MPVGQSLCFTRIPRKHNLVKMKPISHIVLLFCLLCAVAGCRSDRKPVDLASLLDEMVDRDALASYPDPSYVTRQFSSYDRASVRPDTSSWYANWDRTQFIRTDSIEGRREFVVFDAEGPGAITRFWVTVADYSGKGVLRFYIDGSATPQIEGEPLSILSGHKLVGAPLSTSVAEATDYLQRGHNLYLPIPYAKSCKITYESPSVKEPGEFSGECFYYNINYRTYERGTRVVSFSMDELEKNRARIERVQKQLVESGRPDSLLQRESLTRTLAPGDSATLRLTGTRAIRELRCALAAADFNQALRSTVLQMRFDGHTTVWVPLGDFMGTGNRLTPYKSFYTEVRADSTLSCYWTMPFKESCEVTVRNLGQEPVGLDLSLYSGDWKWTRRSMYFGAGWTEYNHLYTGALRDMKGTDSQFDINWVELSGRGVYVGDAVTLFNTVADWWGEGDEKIYVDGESFPSHFGTGTEDYYGYAWCMHNPFDHPFIAEPDGTGSTQCGHVSNVRYRALDAIPFERSLKFDMEVWHWCSTWINYAPVTYYYLCAGGTSNRGAEAEMAARKIATHKNDLVPNYPDDNGVVEGEFLDITLTDGVEKSQTILPMQWSNNAQFFWLGAKPGDKATLTFSVDRAGEAQLSAVMTVAPDYGCFDLWLNGRLIRSGFDAYAVALGKQTVDLGKHRLQAGDNTLQVVQRGKNSRASNTCFGLDCLIVK